MPQFIGSVTSAPITAEYCDDYAGHQVDQVVNRETNIQASIWRRLCVVG